MAKITLVLDKRTPTISGKLPLRIRVTHERKTNFISLNTHLSLNEYNAIFLRNPTGQLLDFKIHTEQILHRAFVIADSLNPFNFQTLKHELQKTQIEQPVSISLFELIDEKIITLEQQGRIKTKETYQFLLRTLKKYKENITVNEVDVLFLESFEKWYINKRIKSDGTDSDSYYNTLGVILRNLRHIINTAINKNQVSEKYIYPFKAGFYTIAIKSKIKKFLSPTQIQKLVNYNDFENLKEQKARDYWKILYYCNGINFIDLITLRWDQIQGDIIFLYRTKTKRTTKGNPNPIRIPIIKPLKDLIDIYGDTASPFIFGFFKENPLPKRLQNKKNKNLKLLNTELRSIGVKLNIPLKLTLKSSRDSYASTLKQKGRSIEEISEMMGHQNGSKITHSYLDSFDDKRLFEINGVLIQ